MLLTLPWRDEKPRSLARCAGEVSMGNLLYWAVVFLIIALVAAAFGFGGVAGTAMSGAQLLFWVAIVLFVISALVGVFNRRT